MVNCACCVGRVINCGTFSTSCMAVISSRRKLSLKHLKRRLSLTLNRGSSRHSSIDESLSELADNLTIEENGGIKENGKSS